VDREGIDTHAAPATLLERTAVGSNRAVAGTDVHEVPVGHTGEHFFEHPFVLADFREVLAPAAGLAERDLEVAHERQLAALAVLPKALGCATALNGDEGAKQGDDDCHRHP
jgi:hypothetical protein